MRADDAETGRGITVSFPRTRANGWQEPGSIDLEPGFLASGRLIPLQSVIDRTMGICSNA